LFALCIQSLECHLPIVENSITFILFIKIPQGLARKDGSKIKKELFCFFINYVMKHPIFLTWTIPKFDRVALISLEELPKFSGNNG